MRIWNYISEFFLFRWLLGKLHSNGGQKSVSKPTDRQSFIGDCFADKNTSVDRSSRYYHRHPSRNDYDSYSYGRNNQSFNDFHEEQDDYDMMDDF